MGCIYSHNMSGLCTMSSKDSPVQGCAEGKYNKEEEMYPCVVDEDPDPDCECYESDAMCHGCGADYNAGEECTCDLD